MNFMPKSQQRQQQTPHQFQQFCYFFLQGCGYTFKNIIIKALKNSLRIFSSLLNVMVAHLCKACLNGLECLRVFWKATGPGRWTVVWQRQCRKLTFQACRPCPLCCGKSKDNESMIVSRFVSGILRAQFQGCVEPSETGAGFSCFQWGN